MRLFPVVALLVLSGCQTASGYLHWLNPEANDFESALAAEYLAYSDSEKEQGRPQVAEYFAAKGVRATNGEAVEPEIPAAALAKSKQKELNAARASLVALLNDDMKSVSAQKLARAQLMFDCWAHQRNMNISAKNAPCAEEFQAALAELQDVAESFRGDKETSYVISFDGGSSALSGEALATLSSLAEKTSGADYAVEISGEGAARLGAIRAALIERGVLASRMELKPANNSRVVILSNDVVQDPNQVQVMLKIFGGKKAQ